MYDFLKDGKFLKIICAAGNEDEKQVEKLVYIYTKAGCRFFDVAASKNIVLSAKNAIKKADVSEKVFVCVSVGSKNDQHVQKATISPLCNSCGNCIEACPQNAIIDFAVSVSKCIGCKKCYEVCSNMALSFTSVRQDYDSFLPDIIDLGIDCIEFHVSDNNHQSTEQWEWLNHNFDGILSISIGTSVLTRSDVIAILDSFLACRRPYSTIIQADGIPMSGSDTTNSQMSVDTAKFIQGQKYKAFLNLSGGTNLMTAKLANSQNLEFDGIALGTFARRAVSEYISQENFWEDNVLQEKAILAARKIMTQMFSY